ncbi:expressed unknown protein [Seminavis robusta]|uniref:Uncharacterized protein n=1 Tax=Seminavis robusta TaxID=568900 RepID=A0A9N8E4F5_9STRA|nr:expressed unknown protein [Seminavis robusta]|eukprot:Sro647_g180950.1 n/a (222) ;mRNA; r:40200-40865
MAALTITLQNQISGLNHQGAIALACGNEKEAHRSFKGALEMLGFLSNNLEIAEADGGALHPALVSSVPSPGVADERFFVFGEALLFQFGDGEVPSLQDVCFCSCLSLFNMALTYHRKAMLTGTRQLFLTASRIYEQALSVADGLPEESANVGCVQVLIRNNLAHIFYYELDCFEESLQHLERIKASIQVFENGLFRMDSPSKDEILLNLLLTKPPMTARCA